MINQPLGFETVQGNTFNYGAHVPKPDQEPVTTVQGGTFKYGSTLEDTRLTLSVNPKMLREALCVAQNSIANQYARTTDGKRGYIAILQCIINEIDRQRPLGPDGKHGNRHTETCGCEDK